MRKKKTVGIAVFVASAIFVLAFTFAFFGMNIVGEVEVLASIHPKVLALRLTPEIILKGESSFGPYPIRDQFVIENIPIGTYEYSISCAGIVVQEGEITLEKTGFFDRNPTAKVTAQIDDPGSIKFIEIQEMPDGSRVLEWDYEGWLPPETFILWSNGNEERIGAHLARVDLSDLILDGILQERTVFSFRLEALWNRQPIDQREVSIQASMDMRVIDRKPLSSEEYMLTLLYQNLIPFDTFVVRLKDYHDDSYTEIGRFTHQEIVIRRRDISQFFIEDRDQLKLEILALAKGAEIHSIHVDVPYYRQHLQLTLPQKVEMKHITLRSGTEVFYPDEKGQFTLFSFSSDSFPLTVTVDGVEVFKESSIDLSKHERIWIDVPELPDVRVTHAKVIDNQMFEIAWKIDTAKWGRPKEYVVILSSSDFEVMFPWEKTQISIPIMGDSDGFWAQLGVNGDALDFRFDTISVKIIPVYTDTMEGYAASVVKPPLPTLALKYPKEVLSPIIDVEVFVESELDYLVYYRKHEDLLFKSATFTEKRNIIPIELPLDRVQKILVVVEDSLGQSVSEWVETKRILAPKNLLQSIEISKGRIIVKWENHPVFSRYQVTIEDHSSTMRWTGEYEAEVLFEDPSFDSYDFFLSLHGELSGVDYLIEQRRIETSSIVGVKEQILFAGLDETASKYSAQLSPRNVPLLKSLLISVFDQSGVSVLKKDIDLQKPFPKLEWTAVPGESYKLGGVFLYEIALDQILVSAEYSRTIENLFVPFQTLRFKNAFQIDRNLFRVEFDSVGVGAMYQVEYSVPARDGEEVEVVGFYESHKPIFDLHLDDYLNDYEGDLVLTVQAILPEGKYQELQPVTVMLKRVLADQYWYLPFTYHSQIEGERIAIVQPIQVHSGVRLQLRDAKLLFVGDSVLQGNGAELYFENVHVRATSDSVVPRFNLTNSKVDWLHSHSENVSSLFSLTFSKLSILSGYFETFGQLIRSSNSEIKISHSFFNRGQAIIVSSFDQKFEGIDLQAIDISGSMQFTATPYISITNSFFQQFHSTILRFSGIEKAQVIDTHFQDFIVAVETSSSRIEMTNVRMQNGNLGFYGSNVELLGSNLILESIKEGFYLLDSYSDIRDSKIVAEKKALLFTTEMVIKEYPLDSIKEVYVIPPELTRPIVARIHQSAIASEGTAIDLHRGHFNIVLTESKVDGKIIRESFYVDFIGFVKDPGGVFALERKDGQGPKIDPAVFFIRESLGLTLRPMVHQPKIIDGPEVTIPPTPTINNSQEGIISSDGLPQDR